MDLRFQAITPLFKSAAQVGLLSMFFLAPSVFADTAKKAVPPPSGSRIEVQLVKAPESSAVTLLAFNFGAVLTVAYLLRRRLVRSTN